LSDPELQVITEWGLVNASKPTVPHPTAVIVDAKGKIRYFRQDVDYKHRPTAEELLEAVQSMSE
jgi:peroxiredoxin